MNDNKEIITKNEKFEIVLIGCKEKELPKNVDGREYFYECIINPLKKGKIYLNDDNFLLMKKGLMKLVKNIREKLPNDNNVDYFGELSVSFKNLNKNWIRSSAFNIKSKYAYNIVYSTLNKIGKDKVKL